MKKGRAIAFGDTIGIVAPASPVSEEEVIKAKEELENIGFRVKLGKTCFEKYGGYLAGNAESRVHDLHAMFLDENIDAIMCLRGGYGTPQLLRLLDYDIIANNPKLFVGYSDITALHIALHKYAGLATIHGPMASSFPTLDSFSKDYLLQALMRSDPLGKIENPEGEEIYCLVEGEAKGQLVGGNLSLISSTLGTPYEIDTRGKILFLEDVREEPYVIDRMLTHLALAGKFNDAAGVVLGTWEDCDPKSNPESFKVVDLFEKIIAPFSKPTIYNLQTGHGDINIALPLGVEASLDATKGVLIIEESVSC